MDAFRFKFVQVVHVRTAGDESVSLHGTRTSPLGHGVLWVWEVSSLVLDYNIHICDFGAAVSRSSARGPKLATQKMDTQSAEFTLKVSGF